MIRGQIVISDLVASRNKMGWTKFDLFKHELKRMGMQGGWYAYYPDNGNWYFFWAEFPSLIPKDKLLKLKEEGMTIWAEDG